MAFYSPRKRASSPPSFGKKTSPQQAFNAMNATSATTSGLDRRVLYVQIASPPPWPCAPCFPGRGAVIASIPARAGWRPAWPPHPPFAGAGDARGRTGETCGRGWRGSVSRCAAGRGRRVRFVHGRRSAPDGGAPAFVGDSQSRAGGVRRDDDDPWSHGCSWCWSSPSCEPARARGRLLASGLLVYGAEHSPVGVINTTCRPLITLPVGLARGRTDGVVHLRRRHRRPRCWGRVFGLVCTVNA